MADNSDTSSGKKKKEKECTPQNAERDMLTRKVRNEMKEINERH